MTIFLVPERFGSRVHAKVLAAGLCCIAVGMVHAEIVNISTQLGVNSIEIDLGDGMTGVGRTLTLTAGTYAVTPIDVSTGGAFTAANRFGIVDVPNRGWEWNYFAYSAGILDTKIGFGGGIPAEDGTYQSTAAAAFALAPKFNFSLTETSDVTFYWADDIFSDNIGGVSIDVAVVPEPSTYLLMIAGLVGMGVAARHKGESKHQT